MLSRGLTSLLDSGKNKAIAAAGPAAAAAAAAAALALLASKTYSSPHRNTMLLKDGTTSKNMLPRDLTSLLDYVKNKAIAAAGPARPAAAAASGAAGAGAASLQNAPFATPKHHATEGRNDLQKHAGLDVPSGLTKRLQLLGLLLLLLLLLLVVLLELLPCPQNSSTAKSEWAVAKQQNTMALKDGTTSKNLQKHAVPRLDVPSGFW